MPGPLIQRATLMEIVRAGIAAVNPERLVIDAFEKDALHDPAQPLRVLCAGKAAAAMAAGAARALRGRIARGLVIATAKVDADPSFEVIAGGHPLPTPASERAGRRALALAESVRPGERFLCLLSGGASALMAVPSSGLSLDDKQEATSRLLRAGADIAALNTVRKHLSAIKGGGLALRSAAGCHTLLISDVVGDDPAIVGSGPGVPDPSRFRDALGVLDRYGGVESYPPAVVAILRAGERGERIETLKPSDPRAGTATAAVIGSRHDAMGGACAAARRLGFRVLRIDSAITGEARSAGVEHVRAVVERTDRLSGPVCVVSSGETTVRVTGQGIGGRNQEFALAAATGMTRFGGEALMASVGTDGIDGPTPAAGAIVDGTTVDRARRLGLKPAAFLDDNDAYRFFEPLGDLVITGATGTNVGDLQVLILQRAAS